MRFLIILLPFLILIPTKSNAQSLSDYKWKNRIILLMDSESETLKEQLALLKDRQNELRERDLLIFRYAKGKLLDIDGNATPLDVKSVPYKDYDGLLLLGKDGDVKLKKEFIVPPEEIFELIDSMPMRRAEMKNDN